MKNFLVVLAIMACMYISFIEASKLGEHACYCSTSFYKRHNVSGENTREIIRSTPFLKYWIHKFSPTNHNCSSRHYFDECKEMCQRGHIFATSSFTDMSGKMITHFSQFIDIYGEKQTLGDVSCSLLKESGKTPIKNVYLGLFYDLLKCDEYPNDPYADYSFPDTLDCSDDGKYIP